MGDVVDKRIEERKTNPEGRLDQFCILDLMLDDVSGIFDKDNMVA